MGKAGNVPLIVDGVEEGLSVHGHPRAVAVPMPPPLRLPLPRWATVMTPLVFCRTNPSTVSR
jgi:hypothetical protein